MSITKRYCSLHSLAKCFPTYEDGQTYSYWEKNNNTGLQKQTRARYSLNKPRTKYYDIETPVPILCVCCLPLRFDKTTLMRISNAVVSATPRTSFGCLYSFSSFFFHSLVQIIYPIASTDHQPWGHITYQTALFLGLIHSSKVQQHLSLEKSSLSGELIVMTSSMVLRGVGGNGEFRSTWYSLFVTPTKDNYCSQSRNCQLSITLCRCLQNH